MRDDLYYLYYEEILSYMHVYRMYLLRSEDFSIAQGAK